MLEFGTEMCLGMVVDYMSASQLEPMPCAEDRAGVLGYAFRAESAKRAAEPGHVDRRHEMWEAYSDLVVQSE